MRGLKLACGCIPSWHLEAFVDIFKSTTLCWEEFHQRTPTVLVMDLQHNYQKCLTAGYHSRVSLFFMDSLQPSSTLVTYIVRAQELLV